MSPAQARAQWQVHLEMGLLPALVLDWRSWSEGGAAVRHATMRCRSWQICDGPPNPAKVRTPVETRVPMPILVYTAVPASDKPCRFMVFKSMPTAQQDA